MVCLKKGYPIGWLFLLKKIIKAERQEISNIKNILIGLSIQ